MRDSSDIPYWDYFDDAHPPISDFDQIEVPELGGLRSRIWLARHADVALAAAKFRARPHAWVGIDESGDLKNQNALLIGAVTCEDLPGFYAAYDELRRRHSVASHPDRFPLDQEPKYSGTDTNRVGLVCDLIDLFFDRPDMRFGVIVARKQIGSAGHFRNNWKGWTPRACHGLAIGRSESL
jgi:hypothetical protein